MKAIQDGCAGMTQEIVNDRSNEFFLQYIFDGFFDSNYKETRVICSCIAVFICVLYKIIIKTVLLSFAVSFYSIMLFIIYYYTHVRIINCLKISIKRCIYYIAFRRVIKREPIISQ